MKFKTIMLTFVATLALVTTAFGAETAKAVVNDGSAMESGNYTAFTVSNVEKQQQNAYGWDMFDASAPATVKNMSNETEYLLVTKFTDFEKYLGGMAWQFDAFQKAALPSVNGEVKITDAGKYCVYYSNGAYEYYYELNVKAAPAPVQPTPTAPQTAAQKAKAAPTDSKVLVDGAAVAFDAYNINGNNYFKLRDVAKVISGSEKQFAVTWDGSKNSINLISGDPYEAVGTELTKGDGKAKSASLNTSKIYKDGSEVALTAYTINGNNYFKLRDLGKSFDFNVGWDGANNCITISTAEGYTK